MTWPTEYMLLEGKTVDSIARVRLPFINDVLTKKAMGASRNLVVLQMGLQMQGYYSDGRCDGAWNQYLVDELTECWEQQFSSAPGGIYGKQAIPLNTRFAQDLIANLGADQLKVVNE